MATSDEILAKLEEIKGIVANLNDDGTVPGKVVKVVNGLSEIDGNLGLVSAGEFRAGNREVPGQGFSGVRIAYPAMVYDGEDWHIAGVNNDALQFGLRASDGSALFGGGRSVLDGDGIKMVDSGDKPAFTALGISTTINTESLGEGDVMIGDNSSGQPNLLWDKSAGELIVRRGTTEIMKVSDADAARFLDHIEVDELVSDPSTPSAGRIKLFMKDDKRFYMKDDSGNVADLSGYSLIERKKLTSDQAEIDFTSIPQGFSDLFVVGRWQVENFDGDQGSKLVYLRFNNDSGNNYHWESLAGQNNNTPTAHRELNTDKIEVGGVASTDDYADGMDLGFIQIPSYTETDWMKTLHSRGSRLSWDSANDEPSGIIVYAITGWWNNTSAINRITIVNGGVEELGQDTKFKAGTTVSIYGMR